MRPAALSAPVLQRFHAPLAPQRAADRGLAPFAIPCRAAPDLSAAFDTDISICDVTRGPTFSWKDCVAPGVVEAALRAGLRRVVVASSGNHGRAIAFACRAAGLEAGVLVYDRTPPDVVASLVGLGADVFSFPDRATVHAALDRFVAEDWFSATLTDRLRHRDKMPGGDGYRRIAVAIAQAVIGDPIVVIPTCYGDGASSIQSHLVDLGRNPRLCLVRASDREGSIAASIATNVVTPQVSGLLSAGAWDIQVKDQTLRDGLPIMEASVGKPLDWAEGGIPEALARLTAEVAPRQPIVCVVTGSVFPGLDRRL